MVMVKLSTQMEALSADSKDAAIARKEQYKATEDLRSNVSSMKHTLDLLESRMMGVESTVSDVKRWRERVNGAMFFAGLCGMSVAGFAGWVWNKVLQ